MLWISVLILLNRNKLLPVGIPVRQPPCNVLFGLVWNFYVDVDVLVLLNHLRDNCRQQWKMNPEDILHRRIQKGVSYAKICETDIICNHTDWFDIVQSVDACRVQICNSAADVRALLNSDGIWSLYGNNQDYSVPQLNRHNLSFLAYFLQQRDKRKIDEGRWDEWIRIL